MSARAICLLLVLGLAATEATQQLCPAFIKYLSIDTVHYYVSYLYKSKTIYFASKEPIISDLSKMNELCKLYGGYLLEPNDYDEQKFVAKFLQQYGWNMHYTGVNDIDYEGKFVYYNSKQPATVSWRQGEPNDDYGREDCVMIIDELLNDVQCGQNGRYVCELPLF